MSKDLFRNYGPDPSIPPPLITPFTQLSTFDPLSKQDPFSHSAMMERDKRNNETLLKFNADQQASMNSIPSGDNPPQPGICDYLTGQQHNDVFKTKP
jgi:hypothetical protein